MIPWMREKFAERRARWQQSRKQPRGETSSCSSTSSTVTSTAGNGGSSGSSPSLGGGSPSPRALRQHARHRGKHQHQHQHPRHPDDQGEQAHQQQSCSSKVSSQQATSSGRCSRTDDIVPEGSDEWTGHETIPLRIVNPRGGLVDIEVVASTTGAQLKTRALEQFAKDAFSMSHFSSDTVELGTRYKLIRSQQRRIFRDADTLMDGAVRSGEEFLLVAKRLDATAAEETLRGPSPAEILAATKHIPLSRINQASVNFNLQMLQTDLQQDLRRILISLSKASAYVIGTGPCAEKLIVLFKQRLINRKRHQISSVETLLEMGFSLDKINQALEVTKNVFPAALDWLIQNDSTAKLFNCDTAVDSAIAAPEQPTTSAGVTEGEQRGHSSTPSSGAPSPAADEEPPPKDTLMAARENIEALLEIVRLYSDKSVIPTPELVTSIVEMGFSEENVREALIATHNNQAAACEWLLGNRSKGHQHITEGLPPDSPILRVLMASPQVQISLGNPKMFIALISMLDNSSTMTMWLSDNDTSSVLGHILRTYHEEKHIVAINQFNNAQQSFNHAIGRTN